MNKPKDQATAAPRARHCSTLLEWAGTLPTGADEYTLDDIMKADAIVDAWCGEHDGDDYELVDSEWLKQIRGVEESPLKIRFGRVLVFSCDQGQWVAYSNGSSHWHKLVDVECRRDVRLLLRAMKLDA